MKTDISSATNAAARRHPSLNDPAFLTDAMLGSVARKLRILGFDTVYMVHTSDDEVLKLGIAQQRIIVTADRDLFKRVVAAGGRGILVKGASDLDDLAHIFSKLDIRSIKVQGIGSRCTACNTLLENRTAEQIRNKVPAAVLEHQDEFFECPACGKVYWYGGHMMRIGAFVKNLENRLAQSQ